MVPPRRHAVRNRPPHRPRRATTHDPSGGGLLALLPRQIVPPTDPGIWLKNCWHLTDTERVENTPFFTAAGYVIGGTWMGVLIATVICSGLGWLLDRDEHWPGAVLGAVVPHVVMAALFVLTWTIFNDSWTAFPS